MTTKTPRALIDAALALVDATQGMNPQGLRRWSAMDALRKATGIRELQSLLAAHDAEIAALKAAQPVEPSTIARGSK